MEVNRMDTREQQVPRGHDPAERPQERETPDKGTPGQPEFSDPNQEILTPSGDQTQATEE
jgi:hypothetical protein